MSWYKECEHCGATLDPGERCDCAAEFLGSTKKESDRKSDTLTQKQFYYSTRAVKSQPATA